MLRDWRQELEQILTDIDSNSCSCVQKCNRTVSVNPLWELLEEFLAKQFNLSCDYTPGAYDPGVVRGLSSRLYLAKNSHIKAPARIEGWLYLGENSVINPHAYIRGPVVIGANCVVGGEIKNSVILSGSKLAHATYVGDSIIGRNCNIGAGTVLSNMRFDGKNVIVEIADQRYNTGRKKLGAILEDNVQIGCNSVLNPGTYIANGVIIPPCSAIKGYKKR